MRCTKCGKTDFSEVWATMGDKGMVSCKNCGYVNFAEPVVDMAQELEQFIALHRFAYQMKKANRPDLAVMWREKKDSYVDRDEANKQDLHSLGIRP